MSLLTSHELRARLREKLQETPRRVLSLEGFSRAGVLVPVVEQNGQLSFLLTKRTDEVETHKGQISLPGGMVDSADESEVETALRETEEELGIPRSAVEVLGILDDHAVPSGFVMSPVVGLIRHLPPLNPNRAEVAEVLLVPLIAFLDENTRRMEYREWRGTHHEVWHYAWNGHDIWGATANIIRSVLMALKF